MRPEDIISEVAKVSEFTITSLATNTQAAAEEAFKNGFNDAQPMKETYLKRRDLLVDGLEQAGFTCPKPTGAFYVFAKIPEALINTASTFVMIWPRKRKWR